MTPFLALLLVYLPITVAGALLICRGRDFSYRAAFAVVFLLVFAGLTALVGQVLPFGDGGDDLLYFYSTQTARGSGDLFDTTRFLGAIEQPGFPIVLSFASLVSTDGLLAYKFLNVALLALTAVVWSEIGAILAPRRFGQAMMMAVLLTTPLWYYAFFLLKDLSIVFLQSLFLLGLVQACSGKSLRPWLIVGGATLVLVFFRTPLVVQNAGVAIGAMIMGVMGRGGGRRQLFPLLAATGLFLATLVVVTNPDLLNRLGISGQARVVGSEEMYQQTEAFREAAAVSPVLFPVIYMLTETAGLTPDTWSAALNGGLSALGPAGLRGLLALPWILFAPPFFVIGVRWVLGTPPGSPPATTLAQAVLRSRAFVTPWGAVLLFVVSSLCISWIVGDTTRWRLADMPAILAIAMAGFLSIPGRLRLVLLVAWGLFVIGAASLFYTMLA